MKFQMGNNDCKPCVVVTKVDGELEVMFEGFAYEEAQQWFNSKDVMSSFEVWQEVGGDFEMTCKETTWKGVSEIEKMLNDSRKSREEDLKNCPPGRESDRVDYFNLGDDVIAVSHLNGEVIFDEDADEEWGNECIYGKNMTMEKFDSALGDKGFNTFLKKWCEEEHCTRALISGVDPVTRRIQL